MIYSHFTDYSFATTDDEPIQHRNIWNYITSSSVSVVGVRSLLNVANVRQGFLQISRYSFDGFIEYVFNVIDTEVIGNEHCMMQFYCRGFALGLTTCIDIFKQAACLMYSQNSDAFESFLQNYSEIENEEYKLDGIMKQFYEDIIEFVNNHQCYVLK
jgi:hypothetical protein